MSLPDKTTDEAHSEDVSDKPPVDMAPEMRRAAGTAQLLVEMSRRVLEKRDANDLHAVQWSALRYFKRAGRRASTVMGLARYLGNTTGSASRTARSLLERGLISGETSRRDARSVVFSLTPAGETALGSDPLLEVAQALLILDSEELSALAETLDRVQTTLVAKRR